MEDNDDNKYIKDYSHVNKGLVIAGSIIGGLGIIFVLLGFVGIFGLMGSIVNEVSPNAFSLGPVFFMFLGFPMIVVGTTLLLLGLRGKLNRYVASQDAPVAKDVTNYMIEGTREETAKTVEAVSRGIQEGKGDAVICPVCGNKNNKGDKFCDKCGAPLQKTCPQCGASNDSDATFCAQCGKKFD